MTADRAPLTLPVTVGGPLLPGDSATGSRRLALRPDLVLASAFLLLLLVMVLAPGLFASGPDTINPVNALLGPGAKHPFGTDQLGRDTFARVIFGARLSLTLGIGATLAAGVAGVIWGLIAGLGNTAVDEIAMRLADILMSVPGILLSLLVVAVLGPGTVNVLVAISVSLAPGFARIVRVQALVVKDSPYVSAAAELGVARHRIVIRHVVPNVVGPLLVLATMNLGGAILATASLSFLGLGPQPPTPEWGSMLAQADNYIQTDWAIAVFPGLALTLTVISFSVVGRYLQARFERRDRP